MSADQGGTVLKADPAGVTQGDEPLKPSAFFNPQRRMETDCIGITHEMKYYEIKGSVGDVFVKRCLTSGEYGKYPATGIVLVPYLHMERLKNEVAAINYVRKNTNIPVPTIRCAFEDNGRYYIITDMVSGVSMADLSDGQKATVMEEVEVHLATMRGIKSNVMGGFLGDACLPFRLLKKAPRDEVMKFREGTAQDFVLCHGDLSQHNIIVDEKTLKIAAILDWEYAGFYPKEFEGAFYKRPGPSVAINGEEEDVPKLLSILDYWRKRARNKPLFIEPEITLYQLLGI